MSEAERAKCEICGEPMPPGEEMFLYHGHSGPCPKPPLHKATGEAETLKGGQSSNLRAREPGAVTFCAWCPDPKNPDPEHHPDGLVEHIPSGKLVGEIRRLRESVRVLREAAAQLMEGAEAEGWARYRGTDEPRTGIAALRAALRATEPQGDDHE